MFLVLVYLVWFLLLFVLLVDLFSYGYAKKIILSKKTGVGVIKV